MLKKKRKKKWYRTNEGMAAVQNQEPFIEIKCVFRVKNIRPTVAFKGNVFIFSVQLISCLNQHPA